MPSTSCIDGQQQGIKKRRLSCASHQPGMSEADDACSRASNGASQLGEQSGCRSYRTENALQSALSWKVARLSIDAPRLPVHDGQIIGGTSTIPDTRASDTLRRPMSQLSMRSVARCRLR